jgi:phosphoenolpyruvate carboxykinase (ATP)
MAIIEDVREEVDLSEHGIEPGGAVHHNPTVALLYTHALKRDEGGLAEGGPLVVDTGVHTGRSPNDKFVVRESGS